MGDVRIRKRRRLRTKDIKAYSEEISSVLGIQVFAEDEPVDLAEGSDFDLLFVSGSILGMVHEGRAFLTVRGALRYRPESRQVTVDMGAVPFVTKGADVMSPGVVDADPSITAGDLVFIRDEKNMVPLAVGESLMSGEGMVGSDSGKAVRNVHHVGDRLWKYEEP